MKFDAIIILMKVRVTGVLIENNQLLLLDQNVEDSRSWSLPGGTVEENEPLASALVREMREETGLEVEVGDLLYVCDHIRGDKHVLYIVFEVVRTGGKLGDIITGVDTNIIRNVTFVNTDSLTAHGFSDKFQQLVQADFPERGSYMGAKSNLGL